MARHPPSPEDERCASQVAPLPQAADMIRARQGSLIRPGTSYPSGTPVRARLSSPTAPSMPVSPEHIGGPTATPQPSDGLHAEDSVTAILQDPGLRERLRQVPRSRRWCIPRQRHGAPWALPGESQAVTARLVSLLVSWMFSRPVLPSGAGVLGAAGTSHPGRTDARVRGHPVPGRAPRLRRISGMALALPVRAGPPG